MKLTIWTGTMITALLIAVHSGAVDTGQIKGRVVDTATQQPVAAATVTVDKTGLTTTTANDGTFTLLNVPAGAHILRVVKDGQVSVLRVTVTAGRVTTANFSLGLGALFEPRGGRKDAAPRVEEKIERDAGLSAPAPTDALQMKRQSTPVTPQMSFTPPAYHPYPPVDNESYDTIDENRWQSVHDRPLSTLSVDVDAASYSNVRRFLTQGQLPPADAVRIEELINYFDYDYPDPRGQHPFAIITEVADSPWNPGLKLVHVGLQGKRLDLEQLPPANLVFLIDVSGSMNSPDKLPLLQESFRMLVDQLREEDRVAIVVYAGAAGLVLPSTPGSYKEDIIDAIDRLEAGGSTAGAAGIQLAYQVAQRSFIKGGNNRVILATDGDFNVGVSNDGALVRLIEQKRKTGVFLTVLGFGQGNLKDSKMEKIADAGNGQYAYIDNLNEGYKVMVNEIGGTLFTIAKDVKLQVEFNPARVASYRLVGYENRVMRDRDFDDDRKDAGDVGAGHSVTALYEIELANVEHGRGRARKYAVPASNDARRSNELLTVSFRYKRPNEKDSRLLAVPVNDRNVRFARASADFRFSAAVAEFGMLLRDSEHRGNATMDHVIQTASRALGKDAQGHRREFVELAHMARELMGPYVSSGPDVYER
jgi:Ca-activated chloride channel family protein